MEKKSRTRPKLNERTLKTLFARSHNQCAYPGCGVMLVDETGSVLGDVCHIKGLNPKSARYDRNQTSEERMSLDNLILFCKNHHKIVDDKASVFTADALSKMKKNHESKGILEFTRADSERFRILCEKLIGQAVVSHTKAPKNVILNSPGAIQVDGAVGKIVINTQTKKMPSVYPKEGAVGHDLHMRNYILHLIERYNDFQKRDAQKEGTGKYTMIYRAIKRDFGAKWDLVPATRFDELVGFLQKRILNTKIGRIQNAREQKCFSTWDEWLVQQGGDKKASWLSE